MATETRPGSEVVPAGEKDPYFYNRDGSLNAYGLACGYMECTMTGEQRDGLNTIAGVQTTLWKEHGCYHVRTHDFGTHTRRAWDSTYSLTEARRIYRRHVRDFHPKR